ncbi:QueT transporter family protein [Marinilactibacillus psychrotolerans]|uniref:QueT transporter family protein n=2 Tax=Marinilactibacillus psychrotolerans TaxID=191770 RepID=A0ABW8UNE0_9LACT|nr:QueT transporter family protein [Marinilactibacillus psychrotolerans]GEQ32405.1 queuosine transporter QueT [Marinilactibacillus psychrotolerans]SJN44156.1 Substrate-specific component QueT (COG4708) of predicted queuosine-regulated ECF transporter [Marinilactibacillus psychrotolerans 42ea]
MKLKQWVLNAIIGSLYIIITFVIAPLGYGAIQLRLSEMLNHLVVFNKKYAYGLSIGVVLANVLISPYGIIDWILGGGHTILSLIVVMFITKNMTSIKKKMLINTIVFSVFSFIIAILLIISGATKEAFWVTYITLFISQFITMAIGIPVMLFLDSKIDFNAQMEK